MGIDAESQLQEFLERFSPDIACIGREAFAKMRRLIPTCDAFVHDGFNFLAIGFTPVLHHPGYTAVSIVMVKRWVNLNFSSDVEDREGLLKGKSVGVRSIMLHNGANELDAPGVIDLVSRALTDAERRAQEHAVTLGDNSGVYPARGDLVIHAIAARRRPRR